jgi:hypothetical protein
MPLTAVSRGVRDPPMASAYVAGSERGIGQGV